MSRKTAVISSTSIDLPEHRQVVKDVCLAAGFFPEMMESLPARDEDAIVVSMELVDRGDVYIGLYAHRYGFVPTGHDVSITEMEFDRAIQRGITVLPFLIHEQHLVVVAMVEPSESAQRKLAALKLRACDGRVRLQFHSAQELKGQVESSLRDLLFREVLAQLDERDKQAAAQLGRCPDRQAAVRTG